MTISKCLNITANGFHNSFYFDEKHFTLNGDDDDSATDSMHNDENESDVDWIEIEHRLKLLQEDHEIEADVELSEEWIETRLNYYYVTARLD